MFKKDIEFQKSNQMVKIVDYEIWSQFWTQIEEVEVWAEICHKEIKSQVLTSACFRLFRIYLKTFRRKPKFSKTWFSLCQKQIPRWSLQTLEETKGFISKKDECFALLNKYLKRRKYQSSDSALNLE